MKQNWVKCNEIEGGKRWWLAISHWVIQAKP